MADPTSLHAFSLPSETIWTLLRWASFNATTIPGSSRRASLLLSFLHRGSCQYLQPSFPSSSTQQKARRLLFPSSPGLAYGTSLHHHRGHLPRSNDPRYHLQLELSHRCLRLYMGPSPPQMTSSSHPHKRLGPPMNLSPNGWQLLLARDHG